MAISLAGHLGTHPEVHSEREKKNICRQGRIQRMDRPIHRLEVQDKRNSMEQESSGSSTLPLPSMWKAAIAIFAIRGTEA